MSKENKTLYRLDRRALLRNTAVGITLPSVLASPAAAATEPGGGGGDAFDAASNQAVLLAASVTDVSASIDQTARINDTLGAFTTQIQNGNVDKSAAIDAVERLKLGENLTETALAGLGPGAVESPENPDTLVGAPAGSPAASEGFDIAGATVENALFFVVGSLLAGAAFREAASAVGLSGRLSKASGKVDDVLSAIFGAIPLSNAALKSAGKTILDNLRSDLISEGIKEDTKLSNYVNGQIENVRDPLANQLLKQYEQDRGHPPFDEELSQFDTTLGADNGALSLQGTQSGAKDAASYGHGRINDKLQEAKTDLDVTGFVAKMGDLLAVGAVILEALTGGALSEIAIIIGAIGTFFSLSFTFLAITAGAAGISHVQGAHNRALDSIVSGGSGA